MQALENAQPKDLDASEIDVRLGATWLDPATIQQFMIETFNVPYKLIVCTKPCGGAARFTARRWDNRAIHVTEIRFSQSGRDDATGG